MVPRDGRKRSKNSDWLREATTPSISAFLDGTGLEPEDIYTGERHSLIFAGCRPSVRPAGLTGAATGLRLLLHIDDFQNRLALPMAIGEQPSGPSITVAA
jgi:hypothetical protein